MIFHCTVKHLQTNHVTIIVRIINQILSIITVWHLLIFMFIIWDWSSMIVCLSCLWNHKLYRWPKNNGTVDFFRTLLWSTVIFFFTLLDREYLPHYNNTKIIKFGWKLNILWVISDGLSFSGFAINLSLVGGPPKNGTVDFLEFCSDQQLSLFTLLDRASFSHYNNTKIIKFGWKLFILWIISYGLSFSGICH